MKKPSGDSDLIKLVRDFEAKRQERERQGKELDRIAKDAQKVHEYYEDEMRKLELQRAAVFRDQNVLRAELSNVEGLLRKTLDFDGDKAMCCDQAGPSILR